MLAKKVSTHYQHYQCVIFLVSACKSENICINRSAADVAVMLFELEKVTGLKFDIDVKRPPRDDKWECSITFDGKAKTELNADMCLFLEDWADARENYSTERYADWKDKTLAYYSRVSLEPETQTDCDTIKRKGSSAFDL